MMLTFFSGPEFIRLNIDRVHQRFQLASKATNYGFMEQPYWKLFGDEKGNVEQAYAEMVSLQDVSDDEFKQHLVNAFKKIGYSLKC